MKNILIIQGGGRPKGNTARLVEHFIKGAEDAGHKVDLAEKFIDFGFIKRKSYDDCRHIAAAILAGCDFIISWNFKHIVNVKTIWGIKAITTYEAIKI